ncbi:sugar ABC transporter permease [Acrocarpospora macrocephala]|uniref:ABC transporter permease n=1 Tax=Acrocarpospora macrocephala TaxID=150177 RepID=A0A5M3WZV5_9ACTN|nr:sugar ABC transporter permease [Acrocarpospora macrocephala]GES14434.1 ABC transporter permease [Acrocarpospora macrocephala]
MNSLHTRLPRPHIGLRPPPSALLIPAYTLLFLLIVGPVLVVVTLSLFDYDPLLGAAGFVGMDNFARVLPSDDFRTALVNTAVYMLLTVPVTLTASLLVALGIHSVRFGAALWRSVYFLPVAATLAAMAVAWRWLFYADSGLIDATIGQVLGLRDWLHSTTLALPAVSVVGTWENMGFAIVMFLAGLSAVPPHVMEAARLDGAGPWNRFWHVTWPALGPATVFTLIICTRNALKVFDQVQVMTKGGPINSSTTLSYLLWERGIRFLDIGGGSVITLMLLALILGVTVIQLSAVGRRWERAGTR